jgi:hypothetical protein
VTLCVGCNDKSKSFTAYRIHNVKRVFAHGVGSYSVMTVDENKEIKHEFVTSGERKAKLKLDLAENEEVWVEIEEKLATIHLHSIDEIGGGRKTTDKIKKTTNVIE